MTRFVRKTPSEKRAERIAAERIEILSFLAADGWRKHVAAKQRGERSSAEKDIFQEAARRLVELVGAESAELNFLYEAIDQRIDALELGGAVEIIRQLGRAAVIE